MNVKREHNAFCPFSTDSIVSLSQLVLETWLVTVCLWATDCVLVCACVSFFIITIHEIICMCLYIVLNYVIDKFIFFLSVVKNHVDSRVNRVLFISCARLLPM